RVIEDVVQLRHGHRPLEGGHGLGAGEGERAGSARYISGLGRQGGEVRGTGRAGLGLSGREPGPGDGYGIRRGYRSARGVPVVGLDPEVRFDPETLPDEPRLLLVGLVGVWVRHWRTFLALHYGARPYLGERGSETPDPSIRSPLHPRPCVVAPAGTVPEG